MLKKKKKHYGYLLTCIIILNAAWGCQRRNEDRIPILRISSNISGLLYERGSYWIFQDSISGKTDSTYISDAYESLPHIGGGSGGPFKYIQVYHMKYENLINGRSRQVDASNLALYNNGIVLPYDYNYFFIPSDTAWYATIYSYRKKGSLQPFKVGNLNFSKIYVCELDSAEFSHSGTFDRIYIHAQEGIVQYTRFRNDKMYGQYKILRNHTIHATLKY